MTAQIPEKLILDGDMAEMTCCPDIPEDHPRVVALLEAEREQLRQTGGPFGSTALWRGYIGTWEIRDGRFSLVRLEGGWRLVGDEPLLADWFTGVLRIPRGEMLQYVHMGFASVYERELHVKVERGMVTSSREIDNRGKDHDAFDLTWANMPGGENRFSGDDEL